MNTPRDFSLQLGALITLYLSLTGLLLLLFNTINLALPDATDNFWRVDSYQSSARIGIAMLIVFFPTYLALTRVVNQLRRKSTDGAYLGLTRWLIYLSLVVGGGVLLGDLVVVIMSFLEGDLTTRFLLKAGSLLLVVGTAFYYYLNDARGRWTEDEIGSKLFGAAAAVIVIATLVLGFYYIESPQTAREREIDNQQIGDLQDMQWRIEEYYRSNEALPESLEVVYDSFPVPEAPAGRADYDYTVIAEKQYELCATFAESMHTSQENIRPTPIGGVTKNYSWEYQAGKWCFEREIDDTYRQ